MHQFLTVIDQTSDVMYDLTTVERVMQELPSPTETADKVQADITENSRIIADLCGRVFAQQTVVETFRAAGRATDFNAWGNPGDALNLSRFPVTNFASLTIGGVPADPNIYEIDANAGLVYWVRGFWLTWYSTFPGATKIQATYTGGYNLPDEAPAGLARACIESIREDRILALRSLHAGVQDVWSGDNRVRYFDLNPKAGAGQYITGLSPFVEGLVAPYRRLAV